MSKARDDAAWWHYIELGGVDVYHERNIPESAIEKEKEYIRSRATMYEVGIDQDGLFVYRSQSRGYSYTYIFVVDSLLEGDR